MTADTTGQPRSNWDPARQYRKGRDGNPRPTAPGSAPQSAAEFLEERAMAKGNSDHAPTATQTQSWGQALTGLGRVREAAKRDKHLRFTSLMHHVTVRLLREAFFALKRNAAAGVDDVTWVDYRTGLLARLEDLHDRVQTGRYRARPSRRALISKEDGTDRKLGISAMEDKIVQQALVWVMEAIYEVDFAGFSYGFRPGRSQHQALDALAASIKGHKVNWILDADIRTFFDSVSHDWLLRFLEHRIADPRVLRLIKKWLKAGVMENDKWCPTTVGTPQGAVISPILANVFLHCAFDLWVQGWRAQRARGPVYVIRYADDIVIGCKNRDDAMRLRAALSRRLARFHLELHPEKTRVIEFGRFAALDRQRRGVGKPETFNFLGFTHICSTHFTDGKYKLLRITRKERLQRKYRECRDWLWRNRETPVTYQGAWLRRVLRGYYQYAAVPGNLDALYSLRYAIGRAWRRALRRRSQKGSRLNWQRMQRYVDRWLPLPVVCHPYPEQRFASSTRGRSRMR